MKRETNGREPLNSQKSGAMRVLQLLTAALMGGVLGMLLLVTCGGYNYSRAYKYYATVERLLDRIEEVHVISDTVMEEDLYQDYVEARTELEKELGIE